MQYPFSLAVTIFAFSSGFVAAGIIYFLVRGISKKKTAVSKISQFIIAVSIMIASLCCYFLYFRNFQFSLLNMVDIVFLGAVFCSGVLYFFFTKFCTFCFLPLYLIASLLIIISLWSIYPRKKFFEYTQNSPGDNKVVIVCHEMSPYVLIPGPRIWYEIEKSEKEILNPLFSFIDKTFLLPEKKVIVELPAQKFYPVIYKLNIECDSKNLGIKTEPVL